MKLSAPKAVTFWFAIFLGVLGMLVALLNAFGLGDLGLYLVVVGFVLLALGNLLKGL